MPADIHLDGVEDEYTPQQLAYVYSLAHSLQTGTELHVRREHPAADAPLIVRHCIAVTQRVGFAEVERSPREACIATVDALCHRIARKIGLAYTPEHIPGPINPMMGHGRPTPTHHRKSWGKRDVLPPPDTAFWQTAQAREEPYPFDRC